LVAPGAGGGRARMVAGLGLVDGAAAEALADGRRCPVACGRGPRSERRDSNPRPLDTPIKECAVVEDPGRLLTMCHNNPVTGRSVVGVGAGEEAFQPPAAPVKRLLEQRPAAEVEFSGG